MAEYVLRFKSSAAKEFKNLPSENKRKIEIALNDLSQNPRPNGVVKLQGDAQLYRIRIGDYRVVYQIDDTEKLIRITRVRHRKDVYKS